MEDKVTYNEDKYYSFLLNYEVKSAYEYLMECGQNELASKLEKRMRSGNYLNRTTNESVREIDNIYQDYYKNVFWVELGKVVSTKRLYEELFDYCEKNKLVEKKGRMDTNDLDLLSEELFNIEDKISEYVKSIGYHYLGGRTSGYFGPYIWKTTKVLRYEVELPNGKQEYIVNMMSDFVSKSWLDYISLGVIATGGWQNGNQMNCIASSYPSKIRNTSNFKIKFLKHEAQHAYDFENYPNLSSLQLEYRAKLVELIYYPRISLLYDFISYSSDANKENAHSYASYLIIKGLSEMIFIQEYIDDKNLWKGKLKQVKECSRELFDKSLSLEL